METRRFLVLRGCNRWSRQSAFELNLDLSALTGRAVGELPNLKSEVLDRLPRPTQFVPAHQDVARRLASLLAGTLPAVELPEYVCRVVLGLTGCPALLGSTTDLGSGVYRVILGFRDEVFDRSCVRGTLEVLNKQLRGEAPVVDTWLKSMLANANLSRLGPSTLAIVKAVERRGVPVRRLNSGSLVQLGWGSAQRRIWTAQTDQTSSIASDIASDKDLTRRLLHNAGIPAPMGRVVESADDAWMTALEVGLPVVVKPRDSNHAQGVAIGLTSRQQVETAFQIASTLRPGAVTDVIVERFIPGVEHRLLVVGGKMVAAYRGQPALVVGDGRLTIRQLVDQANEDPRRGRDWHFPLDSLEIDSLAELVLEDQGYRPDEVPPPGVSVVLTRSADTTTDVTDEVHPEVAARVVEAAAVVGLDIAGMDLVTPDISRPLEEQGGAIVEVNAGPGLMFHLNPAVGKPRPVGEAIAATLFPEGDDGRIPVVLLLRSEGGVELARVASALSETDSRVGVTGSEGTFLGTRPIAPAGRPMSESTIALLSSCLVDLVLAEAQPVDILEHGLGFDYASLVILDLVGWKPEPTAEQQAALELALSCVAAQRGRVIVRSSEPLASRVKALTSGRTLWIDTSSGKTTELHPGDSDLDRSDQHLVPVITRVLRERPTPR